jgi:hypothetical protein
MHTQDVPGGVQGEPGTERLEPKVIFLVHHHAGLILHQQSAPRTGPGARLGRRQLATHQVSFMEELAVQELEPVEPEADRILKELAGRCGLVHVGEDRLALGRVAPGAEPAMPQVPGQPESGRDDQMAPRAAGLEPGHPAVREKRQIGHSCSLS